MSKPLFCSRCGAVIRKHSNPFPTTDVIIHHPDYGIVLIERKNPPLGLAIPGGFVDEGESVEQAAIREMLEETGLAVSLQGILGVYSAPGRDPRFHTLTVTFVARPENPVNLQAGDDAVKARFYPITGLPDKLCFDHSQAIQDFLAYLDGQRYLVPCSKP